MFARLFRVSLFGRLCLALAAGGVAQAQNLEVPPSHRSDQPGAGAAVKSVEIQVQPPGLAVEISLTVPFVPQPLRLTNPDRLVLDFPGYELQGGNRRIAVDRGPVLQVRLSLFQSHPPVTRIVIDSKEPVPFEMKPSDAKVVLEIPLSDRPLSSTAGKPPSAPGAHQTGETTKAEALAQAKANSVKRGTRSQPTAYSLQVRARALQLEDLPSLEDKAAAGDPEAQTTLALAYHDAILLKSNDAEALRLLHQAADRGFMAAEESLGIFLQSGIGVSQPAPADAIDWYKKAVRHGSLDAATNIALMYAGGIGVPKDPAQAVLWFRQAAEGGDATAQYNLALIYERGEAVPQDFKESVRWLTAAADQNVLPAILDLGAYYMHPPHGAQADVAHAVRCYEKAADLGSPGAQAVLGNIFASGMLGRPDFDLAVKWYKKGAEQGQRDAQYGLGVRYARGEGVPVDPVEARRLFTAAAEHGLAEAQLGVAIMLEDGAGGVADPARALYYYRLAADQGMNQAQFRLGLLLASHQGAEGDRVSAYQWLMLSQSSVKESAPALSDLRKSMSEKEVAEAERRVDQWRAAHAQEP